MRHLITIILFGAIWGLFEATLGGVLHIAHLPFTGTIMASIGFTILYSALKAGAKPAHLFAVALIAASFKFLDAPLFGLPLVDRTIINPAVAISSQGLACAVVLRYGSLHEGWPKLSLRFLAAAAIATVIFNGVSLGLLGWETNQTKHALTTALIHLPIMAIAATALSRVLVERVHLHMSACWQATAAAGAIVLTFAAKIALGAFH
jgi:hypothetical protein